MKSIQYICTIIKKDMRYRLELNGEALGNYRSMVAVADYLGCTKQHIYIQLGTKDEWTDTNEFVYKKRKYKVIDRLSELS